jgi:integrase
MESLRDKLEALLQEMNGRWTSHHLNRYRPLEDDELENEEETIEMVRSDCMQALQTGNWRRWIQSTSHFITEHELDIAEGSPEFRELCYELGKLEARTLGFSLDVLHGDILALPTENALAPVAAPTVAQPKAPLVGNAALPLSAVYERFCRHKSSTGAWKDPEVSRAHDYDPIIPPFIALVGDKPLGLLSSEDIGKFAEHVLQGEGRKIGTKKRDLDRVKAMLNYARKHLGGPDVSGPLSLEMSYNALHDSYEPFTGPELVSLFESETYNSNSFRKASQFWLPLIGLYTGARIDEPASMLVKDIVEENGIWAFYMSGDEANKGGKNIYAPRWLPIHPQLIAAGLLEYVALLKDEGHARLFPDIGEAARDGFAKRATTDFTEYRRSVGVGTEKGDRGTKVFHSFRSTVSTHLTYEGVDGETARRIVGHAAKDVHGKVYLKNLDSRWLVPAAAALSKLNYGLSHPKFSDTDAYRKARKRLRRGPVGEVG